MKNVLEVLAREHVWGLPTIGLCLHYGWMVAHPKFAGVAFSRRAWVEGATVFDIRKCYICVDVTISEDQWGAPLFPGTIRGKPNSVPEPNFPARNRTAARLGGLQFLFSTLGSSTPQPSTVERERYEKPADLINSLHHWMGRTILLRGLLFFRRLLRNAIKNHQNPPSTIAITIAMMIQKVTPNNPAPGALTVNSPSS